LDSKTCSYYTCRTTPLLILDEAVGLDDENVAVIAQLITLLSQQTNIAILYISHRIEPNIILTIFELIPTSKAPKEQ
jgi:molybdate transport system ATP-binding protein